MKHYLVLLLSCISLTVFGQRIRQFTPEPEAYLAQVKDVLKESKGVKGDDIDSTMAVFRGLFNENLIEDAEFNVLVDIGNTFIKKRLLDYEEWFYLVQNLAHLKHNEEEKYALPWLKGLAEFSAKNPSSKSFDFLKASYNIFYDYKLFDDGRIRWQIEGGDYSFSYEGEPLYKFDGVDIWGYYKNDSTLLEGVKGTFSPLDYTFKGEGGTVYFTRSGLSQDSAYAELKTFTLNTSKTDFEADSVVLHTLIYLKEPLEGRYEEKLTSQSRSGSGTFPRFTSYRQDISIPDILPNVDFFGGFSIIGGKLYGGGGTDSSVAKFGFKYEGEKRVEMISDRFLLRPDVLSAEGTTVKITIDEDSIYHPKVSMRYLAESQTLRITRYDEGLGQTSFRDSYHNMDMLFQTLEWKLDEPLMNLGNLNMGSESPVFFESQNYFRRNRFDQLRGVDNKNPLLRLAKMAEAYKKRDFTDEEVAHFMRMDLRSAHIFMMQFSVLGFVDYDYTKRKGIVLDKVFNYLLNAAEKRDYDVIQFVSNMSSGSNATLSLLDYSMEINGIERIALSDSQKVALFPKDQQIKVYKDLNFDFDGKITAGRFSYWGNQFGFKYDEFRINMDNVDSMRFKVESFDANTFGQRELVDVKTVLQDLTGELLIDEPNNKSGKESYSEYPKFISTRPSYIYYDKKEIFNRVYPRETFYVTLEPFEIDSLDNISTQGLKFDGTFTSAGIFPDLQEPIKVQPDYSLGFTDETPSTGLAAYGKGTFTNTISLSNEGLRGWGDLDYLNSAATSDEFFFFPDSTNGLANSYEITAQMAGPETPHVVGNAVDLHWEPYNDVLYTTSKETPFAMYDDIGMLAEGTLAHGPTDLRGKGFLQFLNAETRSQDYLFKNRDFSSDKLAFRVRAHEEAPWGFEVKNARGEVDFDREVGDFYLNDPADYFNFPDNQYICYMDYAHWLIPEKAVDVKKLGDKALSTMVSTRPPQDSLHFQAGHTKFYLENSLLKSYEVPNIDVADASIFPDTGYVEIEREAKMRTLTNAAITASRDNKFHDFFGATVDVFTRHKYEASADYEYLDMDGTPWPIHFEKIRPDTNETTVGSAFVAQSEGFYMSPYFAYYGKVGIRADRRALDFEGNTHIETQCEGVETDWFAFKSIVDPQNIIIDLPEIDKDDKTKHLNSGVYLNADTVGGYAAFLSSRVTPYDKEMFWANGRLYYDETIGSYVIVDSMMLEDENAKGNYLAFNNTQCTMHGTGEMSLGGGNTQLELNSYGVIDYNLENDNMAMDMVLGINFPLDDAVQKQMALMINKETLLEGSDLGRDAFQVATKQLLKPKDVREFNSDIAKYGAPEKFPKEFENALLLSDLKMNWTPEALSFLSEGKVGIASLGKYPVNKKLEGYMEIKRSRRGDEIYLYLEADRSTYYYFEYKRNRMTIYSSDDALMTIIKELDIKKRRSEVRGLPPFVYMIGTKGKMSRFLSRFDKFE